MPTLAREHIRQELVETCLAARQVILRVVRDVLDEQVVLSGIGDEDRVVLEHEVECARVRFVVDQFSSVDIKYLDRKAKTWSELGVRTQMTGCAGEANQSTMSARHTIDALCIRRGYIGQNLDFR